YRTNPAPGATPMPARRSRSRRKPTVPVLLTEIAVASTETILHRTALAASGRCSPMEYQRMISEKILAMQQMTLAAMVPGVAAAVAPGGTEHLAAAAAEVAARRLLRVSRSSAVRPWRSIPDAPRPARRRDAGCGCCRRRRRARIPG